MHQSFTTNIAHTHATGTQRLCSIDAPFHLLSDDKETSNNPNCAECMQCLYVYRIKLNSGFWGQIVAKSSIHLAHLGIESNPFDRSILLTANHAPA